MITPIREPTLWLANRAHWHNVIASSAVNPPRQHECDGAEDEATQRSALEAASGVCFRLRSFVLPRVASFCFLSCSTGSQNHHLSWRPNGSERESRPITRALRRDFLGSECHFRRHFRPPRSEPAKSSLGARSLRARAEESFHSGARFAQKARCFFAGRESAAWMRRGLRAPLSASSGARDGIK